MQSAENQYRDERVPFWILLALAAYTTSFVVEAPLRFALGKIGAPQILYLRDLLLVLLVITSFWMYMFSGKHLKSSRIVIALLAMGSVVAWLWFLGRFMQVLFAVKIFMPLLVCCIYGKAISSANIHLAKLSVFLATVTAIGVIVNSVVAFPWVGSAVSLGGLQIEVSREWYSGDFARLAGFARASYDAATYMIIFSLVIAVAYKPLIGIFFWALSAVVVVLTTTKGVFLAFGFLSIILLCKLISKEVMVGSAKVILIIAAIVGLLLPLVSLVFQPEMIFSSKIERILLFSFYDRMNNTWPQALYMLDEWFKIFIGRGIGGFGAPQAYFESRLYNPADNIWVYFIVSFGALGAIGVLYVIGKILFFRRFDDGKTVGLVWAVFVAVYGITSNMVDNAVLCMAMGYLISNFVFSHYKQVKV